MAINYKEFYEQSMKKRERVKKELFIIGESIIKVMSLICFFFYVLVFGVVFFLGQLSLNILLYTFHSYMGIGVVLFINSCFYILYALLFTSLGHVMLGKPHKKNRDKK